VLAWLAAGTVVFFAFQNGIAGLKTVRMLNHQIQKIAASEIDGSILLLGDSTLRASIVTETYSDLVGRPVLNLGLNGGYGYAGDLNLLRRALDRGTPDTVVLFHSTDMITRRVAYQGFAQSVPSVEELAELPVVEVLRLYFSFDGLFAAVTGLTRWIFSESEPFADGLEQGQAMTAMDVGVRIRRSRYLPNEINAEKVAFLARVTALCREHDLRCVYAHGPLYDEVCRVSEEYFTEANRVIEATGVPVVVGTPYCMPLSEVGDSEDHPATPLAARYTRRYHRLLEPYLGR
jgi:hypothetical protein